jgi:hypothetical protein
MVVIVVGAVILGDWRKVFGSVAWLAQVDSISQSSEDGEPEPSPHDSLVLTQRRQMKTRWAGVGLIGLGILFVVLFIYLPIRDGSDGFMGPVRLKALLFTGISVVTGLAFIIGGPPVLAAFQTRPRSRKQVVLVLSILVSSEVLAGIAYWQIKGRWLTAPEPLILDASPKVPVLPERPTYTPPVLPKPPRL